MRAFWGILLASCVGCTGSVSEQQKESAKLVTDVKTPDEGKKKTLEEKLQAPQQPIDRADLAAVVEGNNQFALDLYHQLSKKSGNTFFSPFSISTTLAITYAGAGGETADEMFRALHLPFEGERLHKAFKSLMGSVQSVDNKRDCEISVANSLWVSQGRLPLALEFQRIAETEYGAVAKSVDFSRDPDGSRRAINAWVEKKTRQKIKDVLPPDSVTPDTRLVLANAIHFRGGWAFPFYESNTRLEPFTIEGKKSVQVPMMHRSFVAKYLEAHRFELAEFMFGKGPFSMIVVLPKKGQEFSDVAIGLSAKSLSRWLAEVRPAALRVALPKFQANESYELNETLQAMGMKTVFGPSADLSKFGGPQPLHISAVQHKAFVAVDEKGAEAAAATAVVVNHSESDKEIDFSVNRPFLFAILHRDTKSILMLGRINDPSGEQPKTQTNR